MLFDDLTCSESDFQREGTTTGKKHECLGDVSLKGRDSAICPRYY